MFDFALAPENLPFSVALAVMLGIAVLEGVTALFGAALSGLIDALLPDSLSAAEIDVDFDLDADADLDIDADMDADVGVDGADGLGAPTALSKLLGWLCVGRVPVLILFVAFLMIFGLVGLFLQSAVHSVSGFLLPGWVAAVPTFFVALPCVRVIGRGLAYIIPKDETSAVSSATFVGRVATITLGTARRGEPAQAKLHDQHGQAHYVMVEPDIASESFDSGSEVILVSRRGSLFRAIRNTSDAMVDGESAG